MKKAPLEDQPHSAYHIGEAISERLREINLHQSDLARMLSMDPNKLGHLLKKADWDAELLLRVSRRLETDFFEPARMVLYQGNEAQFLPHSIAIDSSTRFHLGEVITAHLEGFGMSKAEFGRRIWSSRQNVATLLQKPSLSTRWLIPMSKALHCDLFSYYSDRLPPQIRSPDPVVYFAMSQANFQRFQKLLDHVSSFKI